MACVKCLHRHLLAEFEQGKRMRFQLFLTLVLIVPPLWGGDAGPGRSSLEHFASNLETLHASFSQTITAQDGRRHEASSGEVWMKRPGLFRWAYGGEFPELIVADGVQVWMYDLLLEQVVVKPQSALAENSPLLLLTSLESLDEQFLTREVGVYDGMNLLELVSKNTESEFERVLLGFAGDELRMMTLEDAFGMRTEIRFSEMIRNPELDSDLFRFKPPDHVDVVGEIPGSVSE